MLRKRWPRRALIGCCALILGLAPPAFSQQNLIVNGDFEGGFAAFMNPDPLDSSTPDDIPVGWLDSESFTGGMAEASELSQLADNGPSRPGSHALGVSRTDGGVSGDETAIRQDLAIDARGCAALTLDLDVLVVSHNLEAGGTVTPAFEWPAFVWIDYTTLGGAKQVWRHGWYVDPPGDGTRTNDPGAGLIPLFNDEEVTPGEWDANHFDLFAELPELGTLDRIYVGGAGWDFQSAVDNVQVRCTPNLRLNDRRFQVDAFWHTTFDTSGVGHGVQLTDDSGYFWFFNPDNIEVIVKVLDACVPPFHRYWVFAAGLTNVEVTLRVRDLAATEEREYHNDQGHPFAPILDTGAFDTCAIPDPLPFCFPFDDTPVGTAFGDTVGQVPGQVVWDEQGVVVTVENFYFTGSGMTFGHAVVDPPGAIPGFGDGNTIGINNLGFKVDYSGLPYPPSRVTFDFADLGGSENLAVNGQPMPPFAGELTAAPCPLGGVSCSFTTAPAPPGLFGTATLTGPISTFQFGGQELWIDDLCALP